MYMKNIFKMMLLLTMALFMSCGDDDEVKLPDTKDVNYANIAGTWRLSEWNGEKIDGDTRYYYIKFGPERERRKTFLYHLYKPQQCYVPANSRLLYSE